MSSVDDLTADQVTRFVAETLGTRVLGVPSRTHRGFGNASWRVVTEGGAVLVKISRAHLPSDKIASAAEAQRLAVAAGVPTPQLLHLDLACACLGGHPVRVQTWIEGRHRNEVLTDDVSRRRFHAELGEILARLHTVAGDGFSSRVGQPGLDSWQAYVERRRGQIEARVDRNGGLPGVEHRKLLAMAGRVAAEVSPLVSPRLVHRDLYEDNLLAEAEAEAGGGVAAVLDLDIAEVWDPLADAVRLRWLVLPPYGPVAANAFWDAYFAVAGRPEALAERMWVVDVLELVNTATNAFADGSDRFARSALERLIAVGESPTGPAC